MSMSWNYRIVKQKIDDGLGGLIDRYSIHETFYDEDGGMGWTANPITPQTFNESDMDEQEIRESLRWQLTNMLKALDKDIIEDGEDFERYAELSQKKRRVDLGEDEMTDQEITELKKLHEHFGKV